MLLHAAKKDCLTQLLSIARDLPLVSVMPRYLIEVVQAIWAEPSVIGSITSLEIRTTARQCDLLALIVGISNHQQKYMHPTYAVALEVSNKDHVICIH